jgi:microtubule-associated protein-like 6
LYSGLYSKGKFSKFKQYSGHSAHVTRVRWTQDGSQLISIGGGDTAILVWDYSPGSVATSRSIQRSNDSIQNIGRGESEDSATDSEDEGYDSDVKREKNINYFQSIFVNPMKRANANAIKTVQTETGHKLRPF